MKRIFLSLLIVPLLGYGGVKAYLWYSIKSGVDDAIAAVAPYVSVTYDGIFSSLDGTVGIEGLLIHPTMTNDEFTVKSMSVSSESILDFMGLEGRFKRNEFPKHLAWEIQQVNLDLGSEVFRMLHSAQQQAANAQPAGDGFLIERLDALGCGEVEQFGLDEYIGMGYSEVNMDIAMQMEYREASQQLHLGMQMKDGDLYDADFEVQFAIDLDAIKAGVSAEPPVAGLKVTYTDNGYYKLRNAYCASQIDGTATTYIDANIAALGAELGGELPPKVMKAYRQFMLEGGTVTVNLSPADATQLSGMEFYETADAMRILGMTMSVNNVQFDADQIQWKKVSAPPDMPAKPKTVQAKLKSPVTHPRVSPPVGKRRVLNNPKVKK